MGRGELLRQQRGGQQLDFMLTYVHEGLVHNFWGSPRCTQFVKSAAGGTYDNVNEQSLREWAIRVHCLSGDTELMVLPG